MAESNVIGLVIAVILFVMILLVGMGAVNKVQTGLFDMWKIGDTQKEQLEAGSAIAACQRWLGSPDKYKAKAIVETFKIPDKMAPFGSKTGCCWDDKNSLKDKALDVQRECAQNPGSTKCNNGFVKFDDTYVKQCVNACNALIEMSNLVDQQCTAVSENKKQSILENTLRTSTLCSSSTRIGTIKCS